MKNLKYFFIILISIFVGFTQAMGAAKAESKAATAGATSFDLKTINERLSKIKTIDGHVQLQEAHDQYTIPDFDGYLIPRQINIVFIKENKQALIGIRQYKIMTEAQELCLDSLEIDEPYRRYGFGTLLILAALNDEVVTKHACTKASVLATNEKIQALYRKIGFLHTSGNNFVKDGLQTYIKTDTPALLEAIFTKLETPTA